jgi:FkbM family methyltransferase
MGLRTVFRKLFGIPSKAEKEILRSEEKAKIMRIKFYSSFLKKDDLCFDVGANVGNRIEPLLKVGARVVAIEPQESCITQLKDKFGDKIKLVTSGLGEKEGVMDFYICDASTISSFSKDWIDAVKIGRFKNNEWNKIIKTPITTLDNLIKEYGKPDFIKIDVEGFELEVLKGLHSSIRLISFEYTVPEQVTKAISCIELINGLKGDIECNYSIGESMEFALDKWISYEEMIKHIQTEEFIKTDFGDIYVRNEPVN